MKKRILSLLMAMLLLLSMAACRKEAPETAPTEVTEHLETAQNTESTEGAAKINEIPAGTEETDAASETENVDDARVDEQSEEKTQEPAETHPADVGAAETVAPTEAKPGISTDELSEYEEYLAMSGAEQKAFMESFGSVEAFFVWLQGARADHEAANPVIEIDGDTVSIEEILKIIE